jgi:hypothetical protein
LGQHFRDDLLPLGRRLASGFSEPIDFLDPLTRRGTAAGNNFRGHGFLGDQAAKQWNVRHGAASRR